MARKKYYDSCPYCGNNDTWRSVYTKIETSQYYDWNGNEQGFADDDYLESRSVYCSCCDKRITTLNRLEEQGRERGLYEDIPTRLSDA